MKAKSHKIQLCVLWTSETQPSGSFKQPFSYAWVLTATCYVNVGNFPTHDTIMSTPKASGDFGVDSEDCKPCYVKKS